MHLAPHQTERCIAVSLLCPIDTPPTIDSCFVASGVKRKFVAAKRAPHSSTAEPASPLLISRGGHPHPDESLPTH